MSYYAGRWARAQTLVLDRDSVALAVLKELADDYRDDQGACRIDSYKKLALAVGLKKPDTASAAVSRLQSLGLIKAEKIYSHVTGQILGTRFSLVGYVKAEWPESRQGQLVWVETAIQKGLTPQKWWPQKTGTTRETDITQKKDVPHETDVPRQTGEGTPSNGERYPVERGEGTPSNGDPLQGLTGNPQGLTGNSLSPLAPASDDPAPTAPVDGELFPELQDYGPRLRCEPEKVRQLYNTILPELRECTVLSKTRRSHIEARFRQLAKEEGFTTSKEVLDGFRIFFEGVKRSDFLMGRKDPGIGRTRAFRADLDWLMKESNFIKVCEGKYMNSNS